MERNTIIKEINGEKRAVSKIAWYGTIVGIIIVMLTGGSLITHAYRKKKKEDWENWRPGKQHRLENDLEAINRDGKVVQLKQLKDKVWVMAYQYTDDETGSVEVAAVMKDLLEKFGHFPEFHIVSISANPTGDTLKKVETWMKTHAVDSPRWWFLTGEERFLTKYMYGEFKLLPSRTTKDGKIDQDKNIRIVDGKANIRGYYGVTHPVGGPTAKKLLYRDLEMVLDPSKKRSDYENIFIPEESYKR